MHIYESRPPRGTPKPKEYADYLKEYEKRIAPLRRKRLDEAKEAKRQRKQSIEHAKSRQNPWAAIDKKDIRGFSTSKKRSPRR